jgi:hypothetical protein
LDLGTSLIDTAETYAGGRAEKLTALANAERPDECSSSARSVLRMRRATAPWQPASQASRSSVRPARCVLLQSGGEHALEETVARSILLRKRSHPVLDSRAVGPTTTGHGRSHEGIPRDARRSYFEELTEVLGTVDATVEVDGRDVGDQSSWPSGTS